MLLEGQLLSRITVGFHPSEEGWATVFFFGGGGYCFIEILSRAERSPPGSSVHGISQARILEWVAISFSRGSFQPRDQTSVSCTGTWIIYH